MLRAKVSIPLLLVAGLVTSASNVNALSLPKKPLVSGHSIETFERKPLVKRYPRASKVVVKKSAVKKGVVRASRPLYGYRLTSTFKERGRVWHGRAHAGIDLAARTGTAVFAAQSGRVVFANWQGGYGRKVVIAHSGGIETVYGHLSSINVRSGQTVKAGQRIGRVGSSGHATGPHLHFEVHRNGQLVNPLTWMREHGVRI